ncbi:amidase family protein [Mycobacterium sp. CVI_P3]|uniref:Amidase family protein n=1 Tax=Mycobacterium pinniadriaticum TaxID=2994102 RepID=A0ABT3SL30_9MYCO|nr:amidase family protein [Mycobacterium pinniadriaticum]MCX2933807.1 amidase family protein [Mycobacterium pinniadriaticum]MCX2940229.1 amidase family protein [Mycobacterium pinniadriaticum]
MTDRCAASISRHCASALSRNEAVSVPAGFTSDGLPIGMQLLGPPGSEPLLLSVADALMAANPHVARQPPNW